MPVDILSQADESVLDVCSGRGSKALQIGARLRGAGSNVSSSTRKLRFSAAAGEPVSAGVVIGNAADRCCSGRDSTAPC